MEVAVGDLFHGFSGFIELVRVKMFKVVGDLFETQVIPIEV